MRGNLGIGVAAVLFARCCMEACAWIPGPITPKEEVSKWLPIKPLVGAIGYSGYCGHPPIQQQTVVAPHSEEEESELAGKKLAGLQVIFRHGARIPTSPLKTCFNVPNYSVQYDCGIQESLHWDANSNNLRLKMKYPRATGRCGTGRLQNEAKGQFRQVAEALKGHYDFDEIGISVDTTLLRADEIPRTQASMYLVVSELFPDANEMDLTLLPKDLDAWSGTPPCKNMLSAASSMVETVDLPIVPRPTDTDNFAQLYADVTGTLFHPITGKDCLTEAVCTPAPLPSGFTEELFQWAMNKSLEAQRQRFRGNPEISSVLAAPVLWDVQDRLQSQLNNFSSPRLALYATHDDVMIELLVAMGLWDGEWPAYAEAFVLEAWKETAPSGKPKGYFRLIRRGKPIVVPGCQGKTVCPIEIFQSLGKPWLRDPEQMALYCGGLSATLTAAQLATEFTTFREASRNMKATLNSPLLRIAVILSSFSAFVGACLFQAWKAKHEIAASNEQGYIHLMA